MQTDLSMTLARVLVIADDALAPHLGDPRVDTQLQRLSPATALVP